MNDIHSPSQTHPSSDRRLPATHHFGAFLALVVLTLFTNPARAVNPALSGSLTVPFLFSPDDPNAEGDQSFWYWSGGISGGISLSVPSVMEITTSTIGNLDWGNPNNWNKFPLDSGGLFIGQSGSGTYNVAINGGSPYLDVLGLSGPTEGTVATRVDFTNIHGSGTVDGFGSAFVPSNVVATKYNATIPSGAHMHFDQIPALQNLTINSGASVDNGGFSITVRNNFVNHGSGDFNAIVAGNFTNDAVAASGNVADARYLEIGGQLTNTGELNVVQHLKTVVATGNAGTLNINGGNFIAAAAFANNGTIRFSGGSIDGPGVITNNGTFQWTGQGNINTGAQILNATSAFTISSPNTGTKYLDGTLTNTGTITESGATALEMGGNAILNNQVGALYDITDDSHLSAEYSGTLNNAGTFRKSGGSGDSILGAVLNNTGTVAVTSGKLRLKNGGTLNGGSMSFSGGHEADIYFGNYSVIGTNSAIGNGALKISGGHVFADTGNSGTFANFIGGANLLLTGGLVEAKTGATLTFNLTGSSKVQITGDPSGSGGVVGGLGSTINTGNLEWVHGSVIGNFTNSSSTFTIVAGDQRVDQGHLTNTNTVSQGDGSNLILAAGGTITNQAGALWLMSGTNGIFQGSGSVNNAGTWRKTGAATTSTIQSSVSFNNTGTLAVDSGKLYILGPNVLNLMPAGTLSFKLSGLTSQVDFGTIDTSHSLTVGGKLLITLAAGFPPALGNSFDLIDWCSTCSLDGSFSTIALPSLASGLKWDTSQLYTSGVISVGVGIPGDFDQNNVVNGADYVLWRKNPGNIYTPADYDTWRLHFGETAASGSTSGAAVGSSNSVVPEPNGLLWGIFPMAAALFSYRRCRAAICLTVRPLAN
jgi:hypothetical protein